MAQDISFTHPKINSNELVNQVSSESSRIFFKKIASKTIYCHIWPYLGPKPPKFG